MDERGFETGWVIELGESEASRPAYWIGPSENPGHWPFGMFSDDSAKAVRFARKEDAEAVVKFTVMHSHNDPRCHFRVCDHAWDCLPPPSERSPIPAPGGMELADKLTAFAHGLYSAAEAGLILEAAKIVRTAAQSATQAPATTDADMRKKIAVALAERWPGDFAEGDPPARPNALAFETADVVLGVIAAQSDERERTIEEG